jgi:hypothetical protein
MWDKWFVWERDEDGLLLKERQIGALNICLNGKRYQTLEPDNDITKRLYNKKYYNFFCKTGRWHNR